MYVCIYTYKLPMTDEEFAKQMQEKYNKLDDYEASPYCNQNNINNKNNSTFILGSGSQYLSLYLFLVTCFFNYVYFLLT